MTEIFIQLKNVRKKSTFLQYEILQGIPIKLIEMLISEILWTIVSCYMANTVSRIDIRHLRKKSYPKQSMYSQTSVPRMRMGRIPWLARTDLKVPSIFLIFLSKKNLSLEHQYLEQSNSINGPINNKIMSFTMPVTVECARCDKCQITNR
jgi:hypothetical protein